MERRKRAPFWNLKLPSFGQRRVRALSLHLLLTQLEPLRLLLIKQTQSSSPYAMSTTEDTIKPPPPPAGQFHGSTFVSFLITNMRFTFTHLRPSENLRVKSTIDNALSYER
ncbi:hypothetical protein T11_2605 [Trichinella zimbabwensis]|uniref:Uncharacterized protein n=1 Tax=Trichinella zimbabwensis TaxID=268475 RepID=A0A0V1H113_9BILA|nr:hypothetical protein T11_2605 [Trichinella zimbabwensis]